MESISVISIMINSWNSRCEWEFFYPKRHSDIFYLHLYHWSKYSHPEQLVELQTKIVDKIDSRILVCLDHQSHVQPNIYEVSYWIYRFYKNGFNNILKVKFYSRMVIKCFIESEISQSQFHMIPDVHSRYWFLHLLQNWNSVIVCSLGHLVQHIFSRSAVYFKT